jgi:hypothetical protein
MSLAKRALELPRKSAVRKRIEFFLGSLSDESIAARKAEEAAKKFGEAPEEGG